MLEKARSKAVAHRSASSNAATGVERVEPITRKPFGGASTESPWLIQTVCSGSSPAKSSESVASVATARPYSRPLEGTTSPPPTCAIHCIP